VSKLENVIPTRINKNEIAFEAPDGKGRFKFTCPDPEKNKVAINLLIEKISLQASVDLEIDGLEILSITERWSSNPRFIKIVR